MPGTTKGAWKLQEVRDATLAGEWAFYDQSFDSGSLWAWGVNQTHGNLGVGDVIPRSSPTQIPGPWTNFAGSYNGAVATKTNGTLWTWGSNRNGLLGIGASYASIYRVYSPIQVPGNLWTKVFSGRGYQNTSTHALKRDNTLWGWGTGITIGVNNTNNVFSSPVQIPGSWKCVTGSSRTRHALTTDNKLWGWGVTSSYGSLGDNTLINKSSPIQIPGEWCNVAGGNFHTLALKRDNTLWVWGKGSSGELGLNTVIHRSSPVQVPGTNWIDVQASALYSLGRKSDGTVWAWGGGSQGVLGDNTVTPRSSPVQIPGTSWCMVNVGQGAMHGIKSDNTLWAWGTNSGGGLGDNTTNAKSSPIQIPGTCWTLCTAGGGGGGFTLAKKSYTTCIPYDIIGTHLWSWGANTYGQLGDNTIIHRSSPVQILGAQWCCLSAACRRTHVVKSDNTLWSWGDNASGALGDNSQELINKSSPIQIPGTNWCAVTGARNHSLAVKTDGTLWAWGAGSSGRLGNNGVSVRSSPVQIPGTSWCAVGSRDTASFALKTDGTLWSWGCNSSGELGDLSNNDRSSPVQIPGTQWCYVNGASHVFGIKTDGTLWAWGVATTGRLGNNTVTPCRSSPIQIPGTQWSCALAGHNFTLALKNDNTLWGWGCNNFGQLGNNDSIGGYSSPIQIPGNQWSKIANTFGDLNGASAAIKTDGTLWVWGNNASGQLGTGNLTHRSSPVQVPGTQWTNISSHELGVIAFKCFSG